ncbi:MAG: tRNA (guanosine(46)-N7)-methyltransferase TrmB [Clostridia bacterium]|nr:tRNA (guanosine(46)-N7)-methyltransferase TrmB [Clostridia bacterium]
MRLRKKKNAVSRYDACRDWILNEDTRAEWCAHDRVALEIGSGKGGFITKLAAQNPDIHYIAVEKEIDCIIMAMEKAKAAGLTNLRFLAEDAKELSLLLPTGIFETIYLNFSDPWPKKKYSKRRLTHRNLLRAFLPLLSDAGELRFKTDNDKLFAFSVEEWQDLGMDIFFITYDLHKENVANIMTEYETRFSEMGTPIKSMWARPTPTTFAKLREYTEKKDVFPFHQLIVDISTLPEGADQGLLWRAMDNIGIRMAKTSATGEYITCPYFRLTSDDIVEACKALGESAKVTALLSDNPKRLAEAKSAGLYTIALAVATQTDEQWPTLDIRFLSKKECD